jgi:hypothetical protein
MGKCACNIGSQVVDQGKVKFYDAGAIQSAVNKGFNPYTTPGVDMTLDSIVHRTVGLDADSQYAIWRMTVMADNGQWGLCPSCTTAVSRY